MTVLEADWPAPPGVRAFTTFRRGGVGVAPFDSLNLGAHVGDDPELVRQNRQIVRQSRGWNHEPLWLNQVHGTKVVRAEESPGSLPEADGSVTTTPGLPLVVMTADCLPVVLCDRSGTTVGVVHAGWKGLLNGVVEAGLQALDRDPTQVLVWIGPAIGPDSYQVGADVRTAFMASDPAHAAEFSDDGPGHWRFDLAGAAVRRLNRAGVEAVTRTRWDTWANPDLFFSHRRQNPCGRMGTFICLEKP